MKKNANDDDWEETETDSALLIEDEYRETERNGLLESIKRLPTTYRDVIYLFYYEELSIRRISEILKTSEGAVKTRLSRARSILKDQLTGVSGVE